ncbi:hypothetical protein FNW02_20155 [Komarekiella sp. 'clone 1']|uniref:General stress protein 17M-like domain-containing protein n=1 Tax=Komarekiella delphini-convector SJRDD-AB1 TaxID=2593771 RepID=A0AA40VSD4_9NOST|nr:general stress protein [Komarekiella delphini-convector]MBD6618075.1 hypothetical protein [Komarekiella delphini-convector SJRDD-AB1]
MTLEKERRSVGVFAKRSDAELALRELKAANFPMHKVSVIARNAQEQSDIAGIQVKENTGNIAEEGAAAGAITGGALGSLTGLLLGLGLLAIPGIGPIMLAGAEATAIATALAGGALGVTAGSLTGALLGLGIPEAQAQAYSDLVSKGYYLVIVTGIEAEIRLARNMFHYRGIQKWDVYNMVLPPSGRYKYGIGAFSTRQDVEKALTELRAAGFPMSHITVIAKDITTLTGLSEVYISSSKDNFVALQIPDDLAKYYENQVTKGDYLVLLNGTDIHIAAAKTILENHRVQDFCIYNQPVNATKNDYQILSNKRNF